MRSQRRNGILNERGLNLIEIMTGIAILGILAAIAIPNYTHYINKAKQSEAKANLEMLYSAEKAFHFNYVFYSARIDGVGFNPEGRLNYRVGFGVDSGGGAGASGTPNCNNTGDDASCNAGTKMRTNWQEGSSASSSTLDALAVPSSGPPRRFKAQAKGLINGSVSDTWEIDEGKNLVNTTTGL